jgi:hypothetical protein
LELDREARDIDAKIRAATHGDSFVLATRWAVRPDDLQQALLAERPAIVHFSGHGVDEGLVLHSSEGPEHKVVSGPALANLFGILGSDLRVVVLNACNSDVQARAIAKEVSAAIGMAGLIEDGAARIFAAAFYRALGFGTNVQAAFDLGVNALELEGLLAAARTPQLFVRSGATASSIFLDRSARPRPPLGGEQARAEEASSGPEVPFSPTNRPGPETTQTPPHAEKPKNKKLELSQKVEMESVGDTNTINEQRRRQEEQSAAERRRKERAELEDARRKAKSLLILLGLLALAMIGFAILFGLDILHPNLVTNFVVFILSGIAASVLTTGYLQSTAKIKGQPNGIEIDLAGAIVPLVLVAGGGIWWSLETTKADEVRYFDFKVSFIDEAGAPAQVQGRARINAGAIDYFAECSGDRASFEHVQALDVKDKKITIALLPGSSHRVVDGFQTFTIHANDQVDIKVSAVEVVSGTVQLDSAYLPGVRVYVDDGRNCPPDSTKDPHAIFEIRCPNVGLPVDLVIEKPQAFVGDLCPKRISVNKLAGNRIQVHRCKGTDEEYSEDAGRKASPTESPISPVGSTSSSPPMQMKSGDVLRFLTDTGCIHAGETISISCSDKTKPCRVAQPSLQGCVQDALADIRDRVPNDIHFP